MTDPIGKAAVKTWAFGAETTVHFYELCISVGFLS